jgi:hypothetical protein
MDFTYVPGVPQAIESVGLLALLAPVCRFLKEVYRCTDWPEKRGVGTAQPDEEPRSASLTS